MRSGWVPDCADPRLEQLEHSTRAAAAAAAAAGSVGGGATNGSKAMAARDLRAAAAERRLRGEPPAPDGAAAAVAPDDDEQLARQMQEEEDRRYAQEQMEADGRRRRGKLPATAGVSGDGAGSSRTALGVVDGRSHEHSGASCSGSRTASHGPLIVIDAMNVGRDSNYVELGFDSERHRRAGPPPVCASAIVNAIEHYEHQGFEVVAFLPVWCLEGNRNGEMRAIRHELLVPFKERGILILTPARMDDDMWIIDHAKRNEGCRILTNDHMQKQVDRGEITAEWRNARLVKFVFVRNELRPIDYRGK